MSGDQSTELEMLIQQVADGDEQARNELLSRVMSRLERLARAMLREYAGVKRWAGTDDLLQNALIRLDRSLAEAPVTSLSHFFNRACQHIDWALKDLKKHFFGPHGGGVHHQSQPPTDGQDSQPAIQYESPDSSLDPSRLALWTELQQQIDALPESLREVFHLYFYCGLTHAEIAVVLGFTERTSKRRLRDARIALETALGNDPFEGLLSAK